MDGITSTPLLLQKKWGQKRTVNKIITRLLESCSAHEAAYDRSSLRAIVSALLLLIPVASQVQMLLITNPMIGFDQIRTKLPHFLNHLSQLPQELLGALELL